MREVSARFRSVANASGWLAELARLRAGRRLSEGGPPWQAARVTYDGGARYAVSVAPPALGHYEVEVYLGESPVGRPLLLRSVCPVGLVPLPGGTGCACDAGHEPDFAAAAAAAAAGGGTATADGVADAQASPCSPCAKGTAKARAGDTIPNPNP